jgi:hypothetical protein
MANFGARLAYPTPDWVAYRRPEVDEVAPAPAPRDEGPTLRARVSRALGRFADAWVRAHNHNAYR